MKNILRVTFFRQYSYAILLFCLLMFGVCQSQTKALKVITYNVLYGFHHNTTEHIAVKWLLNEAPDVLVLQELKGYNLDKLQTLALKWGHAYCYLWNRPGSAQPLAITSKSPITNLETIKISEKDKGFLVAKTYGITFMNVHLHPNNVLRRKEEATSVISRYKQLTEKGEDVIILGDFNAMSPFDQSDISKQINTRLNRAIEKGKCSDLVAKCTDWDYSVMQSFYDANLSDIVDGYLINKTDLIHKKVYGTFPTMASININDEETRSQHLHRLDHVLMANSSRFNIESVRIVQDEITETISDHYPVVVYIEEQK